MRIVYLRISVFELAFLLQLFLMSLQILDHQVFPCQLIMISEVIDPLMGLQVKVIQDFIDGVSLDPQQVPVLSISII